MDFHPWQQEPLTPATTSVPPRCCRPGVQHLLQLCLGKWGFLGLLSAFGVIFHQDAATPAELSLRHGS